MICILFCLLSFFVILDRNVFLDQGHKHHKSQVWHKNHQNNVQSRLMFIVSFVTLSLYVIWTGSVRNQCCHWTDNFLWEQYCFIGHLGCNSHPFTTFAWSPEGEFVDEILRNLAGRGRWTNVSPTPKSKVNVLKCLEWKLIPCASY